ncbi:DUF937 domain-containing protein [Arthrobacter sp. UKPF54-2]|uniref:DUF937 domain-containing protein n=1 Tax=Arthrobacter sp. UKPF54-2 TaxID=2600159 RepID=UPI0011B11344|nr:DUF937 domain-containing protein [Arthrobacter sp. UKPF54-2]QDY91543.1 DUF937 domain-containing protein [Arthrobacter sp. UKPF54-2]
MTELQDILGQIPVDQIADMLGTDRQSAQAAVEAAVPTLLAGLHNNAQAPEGAASLESALVQHQDGLVDGGVDAAQVDTADGEKIVNHVFGGRQDQVANQLAGTAQLGGVGGDLVRKLLPLLAPIVMSYLANKVLGGRGQAGAGGSGSGAGGGQAGAGGIDLGGILGGILGGAGGAGGGLGDLLGGMFDGGQQRTANDDAADARAAESGTTPESQPLPQGQPADGAPRPGELIDVDLPGQQPEDTTQDRQDDRRKGDGGLGGLLGGLFGKK